MGNTKPPMTFQEFLSQRDPSDGLMDALEHAWDAALQAATAVLQERIDSCASSNPGRGKGTVSSVGSFGVTLLEKAASGIAALASSEGVVTPATWNPEAAPADQAAPSRQTRKP